MCFEGGLNPHLCGEYIAGCNWIREANIFDNPRNRYDWSVGLVAQKICHFLDVFIPNICRSYRIRPLAANASRNCCWSSSSSQAQLGCAAASFSGALCWRISRQKWWTPLCQWNSLNDVQNTWERSWKKHMGNKDYGKNWDIFFPLFFQKPSLVLFGAPGMTTQGEGLRWWFAAPDGHRARWGCHGWPDSIGWGLEKHQISWV